MEVALSVPLIDTVKVTSSPTAGFVLLLETESEPLAAKAGN